MSSWAHHHPHVIVAPPPSMGHCGPTTVHTSKQVPPLPTSSCRPTIISSKCRRGPCAEGFHHPSVTTYPTTIHMSMSAPPPPFRCHPKSRAPDTGACFTVGPNFLLAIKFGAADPGFEPTSIYSYKDAPHYNLLIAISLERSVATSP